MTESATCQQTVTGCGEVEVVPVAGRIGAVIQGVQLSGDLEQDTVDLIRQAILKYKVVFFRDQHHLDDATHEAFSARLGPLLKHPNAAVAGDSQSILELKSSEGYSAANWHTDMTFMPQVAAFSILRPCVLPSIGGDTLWANTVEAYKRMPEPLKALLDNLWGLHSTQFDFEGHFSEEYKSRLGPYRDKPPSHIIETEHPVVHLHPETGERALILGIWLKRFVGLTNSQSQKLYEIFQEQIELPENTVRWHWQMGDVAIWDNLATQHRSVPDYGDQTRTLRRVTVSGSSVLKSIDGRPSRLRER